MTHSLVVGERNVIKEPLISRENVIFSSQTKLRLMTQYIKALDKNGQCFFKEISELRTRKLKTGILDGP